MTQQKEFNSKRRLDAVKKIVKAIESLDLDPYENSMELGAIIKSAVHVVEPSIGIRFRYGVCSDFE